MGNSSWRVTEEIKSQTKVFMGLYIFNFFFLIVYIGLTYLLRNFVHQDLRIAYYIFSAIMAIFLTLPSPFNKKRRNYQSIFILLKRDNIVYKPIVIKGEGAGHDHDNH